MHGTQWPTSADAGNNQHGGQSQTGGGVGGWRSARSCGAPGQTEYMPAHSHLRRHWRLIQTDWAANRLWRDEAHGTD